MKPKIEKRIEEDKKEALKEIQNLKIDTIHSISDGIEKEDYTILLDGKIPLNFFLLKVYVKRWKSLLSKINNNK